MKENVIQMHNGGLSYREIEKRTGINRGSIAYYINPIVKENRRDRLKIRRARIKKECITFKGGKCSVCGYNKYDSALEFHHLNPKTKDNCVTSLIARNQCFDTIKAELKKCILLCANCHRGYHSGQLKLSEPI